MMGSYPQWLATGLLGLVWSTFAAAAPPPEAASCAACHGAQGQGMPAANYPRLAGLPAGYLAEQLQHFADGKRQNAIMAGMAKPLSPEAIQTLAAYYASLPVPTEAAGSPPEAALLERGAWLAQYGDLAKGVPACFRCHAAEGVGVPQHFPPLTGQSAKYLADQITAWQQGTRRGDPLGLMQTVATRMSAEDTQAVTAYLAAQKPKAAVVSQPGQGGGQ
ncbi:c-type cytochrome [Halothiobacillus sp. DCM-1]|uniref:c-type cytochrome n=1 Tax=Halothiobacillus sp. DCM-1 TaxID=3112558 RepID=UPI00324E9B4C